MVQSRVAKAAALVLALSSAAMGQLNQNCTVSVLNRTVQVNPDGSWVLPNIPANFGQVKARATCLQNGVTIFGESAFFTIPANGATNLPAITLGATTPIPVSLAITPGSPSLTTVGQTVQLIVTATYPNSSTKNVTAASSGTNYTTSNPAIATISADGLVTAVSSGTVVIQASNDGAAGITTAHVLIGGVNVGGLPISWIIANGLNPNDPTLPFEDPDRDGLTNLQEFQTGTDPNNADTDGDGLTDGDEVNKYHTNPLLPDTDGDRIPDGVEIQTGTDPLNPTSYDLKKATATSTVIPPSFTLQTSIANPVLSVQLSWKVTLIDGKTTLDLTADPRTSYSSSDLNICSFGGQPGLVFSGATGNCVVTIRQNTLSVTVAGNVTGFTPTEISALTVPGAVAVDVAGSFAYVATGANGLTVVDVTDRTKPRTRGTLGSIGNAQAVRALGQNVFVADANGFLRVVQVQNPDAPVLVSSLAIAGNPAALALHGAILAVAAQSGGVSLVNIANPATPSLIAKFTAPGSALGVDFDPQTGLAGIAMGTAGLQLADISNPASPKLRGVLTGGDVRRVLLKLPAALLADAQRSVTAVNISNPDSPVLSSSIPSNLGGAPVDIAAFGNTAMTADVSFGRVVPIISIANPLNPSTVAFWTLGSPGFSSSVAVDISFGYLILPNTLRILKYQNIVDTFGIPPTISITSPVSGTPLIQGQTIAFSANATDDVAVASVNFLVNGQVVFTTPSQPYQFSYTVPLTATSITFGATAIDYGNNVGTAQNVVVQVIPDPLTTVTGRVVDGGGTPVIGATVSTLGRSTTTAADGTFTFSGLPTIQGPLVVVAIVTVNGIALSGFTPPTPPVVGGITNVGDIRALPAPTISSIKPNYILPNATTFVVVTGTNLLGSQFSFAQSPGLSTGSAAINGAGTSASLSVMSAQNTVGTYAMIATNLSGGSSPIPTGANSFHVLDPLGDEDLDGLTNAQEVALGTDPFNRDTDGDGYIDGVEVVAGSDPKDPLSTPLTVTPVREVVGGMVAVLNTGDPSTGTNPDATVSIREARGATFALVNTDDPSTGSSPDPTVSIREAVGAAIAVQNTAGMSSVSGMANSRVTTQQVQGPQVGGAANGLRVSIASPVEGGVLLEGQTILVSATASAASSIVLSVEGVPFSTSGKMLFTIPHGIRTLTFQASASDRVGPISESVSVKVEPDALTTVRGRVVDAAGQPVAGASVTLDVTGMAAEFFHFNAPLSTLPDLTGRMPDFTTVVSAVNLRNPNRMFGSDPYGSGLAGDVAGRFRGQLLIDRRGEYTLTLGAREGGRLLIAGTTVLDMPSGDGTFRERLARVHLEAGWIPIEIQHYQNLGYGELQLSMATPGGDSEVIGPAQLRTSPAALGAISDANGAFEINDVAVAPGAVTVRVGAVVGGRRMSGASPEFRPLAGVPIDAGTISLTRGEQQ